MMKLAYQITCDGWHGHLGPCLLGGYIYDHHIRNIGLPIRSFEKQVHGNRVCLIPDHLPSEGDGLVTQEIDTLLVIRTADCVPVHITDGQRIGMVHAGWRGIRAKIVPIALNFFDLSKVQIVLGPAISERHYTVSSEVIEPWLHDESSLEQAITPHQEKQKWYLNLKKMIELQCLSSGVRQHHIHSINICTYESSRFPSYRRNGPNQGRIHNFIYLPAQNSV